MLRLAKLMSVAALLASVACTSEPQLLSDKRPAGDQCPSGGSLVCSGLDDNDDGVLDEAEIDERVLVCDAKTLVRAEAEPAGEHCVAGGAAVRTGTDTDGDGVLAESEVVSTEYVCDTVIVGDRYVGSPEDAQALAGITVIAGDLSVGSSDGAISLPALRHVTGTVRVFTGAPVSLPALETIGGDLSVRDDAGTSFPGKISIPKLKELPGRLDISGATVDLDLPGLDQAKKVIIAVTRTKSLSFPALRQVDVLQVTEGVELETLSLPALATAEELFFQFSVESFELPSLTFAHSFTIEGAPSLVELSLPVFGSAGNVHIDFSSVQSMDLPELRHVSVLDLHNLPLLQHVGLPALEQVNRLEIAHNDQLTRIDAPRLEGRPALVLSFNRDLEVISMGALTSATELVIEGSRSHAALAGLDALQSVQTLSIDGNDFTSVSLPALSDAFSVSIKGNTSLTNLALPALRRVSSALTIAGNTKLSHCQPEAIIFQLRTWPALRIDENDESTTCN